MKERIVDEQIRLIPYYQNDAVSFCPGIRMQMYANRSITGIRSMI